MDLLLGGERGAGVLSKNETGAKEAGSLGIPPVVSKCSAVGLVLNQARPDVLVLPNSWNGALG